MDDVQTRIAAYLDVDDLQQLDRGHHERFSRDFEKYLREKQTERDAPRGMSKVFDTVKGWMKNVYRDARELGEPLSDAAREVFDQLLEPPEKLEVETVQSLERFEQRVAKQLHETGLYDPGECQTNAKLIGAFALAKLGRDENYPTLERLYDHMNLEIERVEPEQLANDITFDWDSFDLNTTMRQHQSEVLQEHEQQITQYDLNEIVRELSEQAQHRSQSATATTNR